MRIGSAPFASDCQEVFHPTEASPQGMVADRLIQRIGCAPCRPLLLYRLVWSHPEVHMSLKALSDLECAALTWCATYIHRCGYMFCEPCVSQLYDESSRCPVCRRRCVGLRKGAAATVVELRQKAAEQNASLT
jgi:hypothetical protein